MCLEGDKRSKLSLVEQAVWTASQGTLQRGGTKGRVVRDEFGAPGKLW